MLHTALATAPGRPMVHVAAAVAGIALTGAGLVLAASALAAPDAPAARRVSLPALTAPPPPAVAPLAAAPPAAPDPLALVFRAGGASYLSLAYLPDGDDHADPLETPPHAALRRSRDPDGVTAAVATVAEQDVPADHLRWLGRRVEVDDVCTATVVGFAVVARRQRSPGGTALPTDAVLRSGHAVLAARLDRCTGSYARELAPL